MSSANPTPSGMANMDWLLSEPLLDAALAQINTIHQFRALQSTMTVAENSGKVIPGSIKKKLNAKEKTLVEDLLAETTRQYLDASGLGALVTAKHVWNDVHFMAEAHGVGSSIPMVSYTGLGQEEMENGMNQFYKYIETTPLNLEDKELQDKVAHKIAEAYLELHSCATGEFGGYEPFESMVSNTPEVIKELLLKGN